MSVEFSNAYQEILLDNFNSVIKQNMLFQTQLRISEEAQKNNKSDDKINLLNDDNIALQTKCDNLLKTISELEIRANVGQSLHDEKTRIQAALNEELRKSAGLNEQIVQQSKTIEDITKQLNDSLKEIEDLKSTLEKKESMSTEIQTILPKVKKTNSKVVNNIPDGSSF